MDSNDRNGKKPARVLRGDESAAVLKHLAEGVIVVDAQGLITFVNEAAAAFHGIYRLDIGPDDYSTMYRVFTEDGRPYPSSDLPLARAVLFGETVLDTRWCVRHDGGVMVTAVGSAYPIHAADGTLAGAVLIFRDDTERSAAEEALREESHILDTWNRTGTAVAAELDLTRVVQLVTDAGVEITGAKFGAFFYNVLDEAGESYMLYSLSGVERSAFDKFPMPRATAVFQPTFQGEGVIRSDDILADPRYGHSAPYHGMPEGHLPVRSYLAVPVASRSGEVVGGLFFGHPGTGRFTERHERLMVGIAAKAAIAIDNARLYQTAQREIEERRVVEEQLRVLNETLETRVVERTRERDRAWKNSRDLQLVVDGQGVFREVNQAWTTILGWSPAELVGHGYWEFVHPDDQSRSRELHVQAAASALPPFENRYRHRDGGYHWISWVSTPEDELIYASGRDVTAQKQQAEVLASTEEALRQSQKMEAVGQLTGGIAHDFNNMLAVVIGSLDFLARRIDEDPRARRYVDAATEAAQRAAMLTKRLLAFSRQQPLKPDAIDVNRLVNAMSEFLRHSLGGDVQLETALAGDLWRAEVDPHQLENVILNLALNARDAMVGGGLLRIETHNAPLEHAAAARVGVPAGQYIRIAVRDSGAGMSPEVMAKAFDPFFTTKEVGKGTGLGLSQVYGFVSQSGGHVKLYSVLGEGSTVEVYLPRLEGDTGIDDETHRSRPPVPGHSREWVLVVEDEPAVREFSVDALMELGYRVLAADGATAALALLDTRPDIALLFTDVVMPGINGAMLAAEAMRRRPALKVLYTTGYARDDGELVAGAEWLAKPFTIEALASKLRAVLDAPE